MPQSSGDEWWVGLLNESLRTFSFDAAVQKSVRWDVKSVGAGLIKGLF